MLRTLAALVILTASIRSLPDVSNYCSDEVIGASGYFCASCLQPVYCDARDPAAPVTVEMTECDSGEVCEPAQNNVAGCVPVASATQCDCSSNICDPFNPDFRVQCGTTGVSSIEDCVLLEAECKVGSCVSCAGFGEGWRPIIPACTAGYECAGEAVTDSYQCPDGKYLNEEGICATPPPTPCASSCSGNCPDLTDCTQYYVCAGSGGVIGDVHTCSSGLYFDPDATPPNCQISRTACSPWTECDFDSSTVPDTTTTTPDSTTTPTTPTTTSGTTLPPCTEATQGNYPCNSCSSCYWSCRDFGGGNYDFVQLECPDGLVFNPDPTYPYCDYQTNLKTCD